MNATKQLKNNMTDTRHNEHRTEKIESILVELASKYFSVEAGPGSLLTVTKAKVDDRGGSATIFFTAFPDNKEKSALDFVKRKRSEFRDFIKDQSRLSVIPFIDFEIDFGEKNRQRIDTLSQN